MFSKRSSRLSLDLQESTDLTTLSESEIDSLISSLTTESSSLSASLKASQQELHNVESLLLSALEKRDEVARSESSALHLRANALSTVLSKSTKFKDLLKRNQVLSSTPVLPSLIQISPNKAYARINNLPFHPPLNSSNKEEWINFSEGEQCSSKQVVRLWGWEGGKS